MADQHSARAGRNKIRRHDDAPAVSGDDESTRRVTKWNLRRSLALANFLPSTQQQTQDQAQHRTREADCFLAAVGADLAGAGLDPHAGNRALAPAGRDDRGEQANDKAFTVVLFAATIFAPPPAGQSGLSKRFG